MVAGQSVAARVLRHLELTEGVTVGSLTQGLVCPPGLGPFTCWGAHAGRPHQYLYATGIVSVLLPPRRRGIHHTIVAVWWEWKIVVLGECLARSAPAVRPQCKLFMSASTHFPYPISLTLLPTIPIVCLYAFSVGISDIRESDCSVVLLHLHVLLDVSSLHLLWVVFDTFARSAPAVCPQCARSAKFVPCYELHPAHPFT